MTGPVVSFSGLASGLDTAGIVKSLVAVAKVPATRMGAEQSTLSTQSAKFTALSSKLSSLQTATRAITDPGGATPTTVTSSDVAVLKAATSGTSAIGTYAVTVGQLAQATRIRGNGVAIRDQAGLFGTGTIHITVGGNDVPIDVTASDTLETVAANINSAGAGVAAGLVFDGSKWHLQVTGSQTGESNAVSITESGTSLGLDVPANQVQGAQDAMLTVDGLAVTSASNVVSDAVPGVTLQLSAKTAVGASVQVGVARDPQTLIDSVQGVVDAYNAIELAIDAESAKSVTGSPQKASLNGDTTLRSLQKDLRATLLATLSGATHGSLGSVGVTFLKDGSLSLDKTKLESAISTDPNGVATLFAAKGTTKGLLATLSDVIDRYVAPSSGRIATRIDGFTKRSADLGKQIDAINARADQYQTTLEAQFNAMEKTMSLLNNQGNALNAILGNLTNSNSSKKG